MGEAADETLLGRMDGDTKDSIEIFEIIRGDQLRTLE